MAIFFGQRIRSSKNHDNKYKIENIQSLINTEGICITFLNKNNDTIILDLDDDEVAEIAEAIIP